MRASSLSRMRICTAMLASMVALASCATTKPTHSNSVVSLKLKPHIEAMQAKQAEANKLSKMIAEVNTTVAQNNSKVQKLSNRLIPSLISQSDTAFRQAQALRTSTKAKQNAKDKKALLEKSQKQQQIADQKASLLMAARQDVDATQEQTRALQTKIKQLTAQKQTAVRLAKIEADQIKHLERTPAMQVAKDTEQVKRGTTATPTHDVLSRSVNNGKDIAHRNSNQKM
jgi:hypothetical protein